MKITSSFVNLRNAVRVVHEPSHQHARSNLVLGAHADLKGKPAHLF